MSCEIYNVILTGETTDELSSQAACANLAKIFSLTEERARAVLVHAPLVVKKNVDADTAKRFQQAFARANLTVRLQAVTERKSLAPHDLSNKQGSTNVDLPQAHHDKHTQTIGITFKMEGSKAFSLLSVTLHAGETLWAESTSVISSDRNIGLNSHDASIRRIAGPDGIYLTQYSAAETKGEICLSPDLPGEVVHLSVNDRGFYIKSNAFLACAGSVHIEEDFSPANAGGGHLYCHGSGDLWLKVCGSAVHICVNNDFNVRSSHLIAWTTDLTIQTSPTPRDRSFVNIVGQGEIWLQSQCDQSMISVYQHMRS